jgi:hypothetical protein
MRFVLERVTYMPKVLQERVLYVSDEFLTAAHLCACGCGAKIRTPLGATEWSVKEDGHGPTMWPSVGNWQQACRSHYWFLDGEVVWGKAWSPAQITAGRVDEEMRRRAYYDRPYQVSRSKKLWNWMMGLFRRHSRK